MAVLDTGSSTAGKANVDSNYQLLVATNSDPAKAGAVRMFSENDPGTITGEVYALSPETSDDYRLRVGMDVLLDNETFNYAAQNTAKFSYVATTLTMALTGGALTTNGTSITTINTAASLRTFQFFPLLGQQTPLYCEFSASITAAMATNTTIDFGLFLTSGSSPYAPADGVYFRLTSAGLIGVINFNGAEVTTSVFSFSATVNQVYQFVIALNEREAEFWIDDVLYGTLTVQTGNGQPCMSAALPMQIRHAIGGTAAGSVVQLKVWDYSVELGDVVTGMTAGAIAASQGGTLQIQAGAAVSGQLTTYANGAEPGAVTLTANTAPATNTLGGLFLLPAAITTAASDYPLFAWLNPAGTTAIIGKVFYCTGVRVGELTVTTALTGGPIILTYALGFGSTASTLATTETASFTSPTTKVARRIPLGLQTLAATAAVGTLSPGFQADFSSAPIPINPGEYLHIILRVLGTNTTGGAPRGSVAVFGYFR